jgi:protease-4
MPEPEYLLERIQLRNTISSWRVLTFLLLGILLGTLFTGKLSSSAKKNDHIARVRINGVMMGNIDNIKALRGLADNQSVKGIIIDIDSGGGSAVAGEEYFSAIRYLTTKKPVVAVLEQVAASSAYMTAIACDYIVSHKFTLTGSIGAIMQTYEVTGLAEKLGVKFINIKSAPLKAAPNPFEPYTEEVAAVQNELISDALNTFSQMVKERRNLSDEEIKKISTGRLYTGLQAFDLKLVDIIGNESDAVAWMQKEHGIKEGLEISDHSLFRKPSLYEELTDSLGSLVKTLSALNAFGNYPKLL